MLLDEDERCLNPQDVDGFDPVYWARKGGHDKIVWMLHQHVLSLWDLTVLDGTGLLGQVAWSSLGGRHL